MNDFEILSISFMVMGIIVTILVEWIKQGKTKK